MKRIFLILSLILIASGLYAQTYRALVKPEGSKYWGYCNEKGEMVIKAEYRKCNSFSTEGYAPLYFDKDKEWGFIDVNGKRLPIEPKKITFKNAMGFGVRGFTNGLALVRDKKMYGYVNTEGKLVIPCLYTKAQHFFDDYTTVSKGETFLIIDKKGNEISIEPAVVDVKRFNDGLAPFRLENRKYGFIGTDGKLVIPAQFLAVGYFYDDMAWAKSEGNAIGYINKDGKWIIEAEYESGKDFDPVSGIARVKKDGQWMYIDLLGNPVDVPQTLVYGDFHEGLAKGRQGEKFGFFNAKNEWAIKPQFDGVRNFKNGFAAAKQGDKWGFIDKNGNWVVQPVFAAVKDMEVVN